MDPPTSDSGMALSAVGDTAVLNQSSSTSFQSGMTQLLTITKSTRVKSKCYINYTKLINLKALLEAGKYIDGLLRRQKTDEISLFFDDLPRLINTSNIHELIQEAEEFVAAGTTNISQINTPAQFGTTQIATNMTMTNLGSVIQQEPQNSIKDAVKFVSSVYQQKNSEYISIFQNPVSPDSWPNYYSVVHHPMCFMYIAIRLKATQQQRVQIIRDPPSRHNLLLSIDNSTYGSMVNDCKSASHLQEVKSFHQLMRYDYLSDITTPPQPYRYLSQLLADLLLIAANCCYYNKDDQICCQHGKNLFNSIKEYARKRGFWSGIYDDLLTNDVLLQINQAYQRNDFDKLDVDQLSDQTVRDIVATIGATDSSFRRSQVTEANMARVLQLIKERQLPMVQECGPPQSEDRQFALDQQSQVSCSDSKENRHE